MARFAETVDFPTPPLPDATAITKRVSLRMSFRPIPPAITGACGAAAVTAIVTEETPGMDFRTVSHSRLRTSAAAGASVVRARRKDTFPPPIVRSLTKPKETMSRENPGYLTCLSASRTACSFSVVVDKLIPSQRERISQKRRGGCPAPAPLNLQKKSEIPGLLQPRRSRISLLTRCIRSARS